MKLSGLCLCSPRGWGRGMGESPPQGQAQCLFCPSPCPWPHRAWHRASVHISHSLTPSPLLCPLSSWQLASPRPHHVQVPETLKRIRYGSGVQPAHTLGGRHRYLEADTTFSGQSCSGETQGGIKAKIWEGRVQRGFLGEGTSGR